MAVDSGRGSSSEEEEFRPRFEADGNQEPNPPIGVTPAYSSQEMAEGLSAQFLTVIAIIEEVEKWISESRIGWNQQQCARLASRYTVIAERLRRMYSDENPDGSSSISSVEAKELLHMIQKWRNLVSSYDESQGLTNVICLTNNQEAFEEHHEELDAVLIKLGWQPVGTKDTMQRTSEMEKMKTFKADAEADTVVMLEKLSQRQYREELAKVVSEKTTVEDVKNLMKVYNPVKLPSYLKIAWSEIDFGRHVREWKRKSDQDPGKTNGWARVWKGKWLGCEFAIKVFKKSGAEDDDSAAWNQQQLLMEAGTLIELQHLHVVRLVGFGQGAQGSVIVMELMDNDLRHFMNGRKPKSFTDREKLDIITQIAKGMRFIHAKDYTHGDLKCSNIMVKDHNGQYFEVQIADLRGSQKRGEWNPEAFRQASKIRRPRWTAPEAIGRRTDPSWEDLVMMDIYSFGMTCYEVVSGQLPFQDIRDEPLLILIREGGRPPLPENMDAELRGLIQSCWDSVQAQRPQSFEVICERLIAIKSKTPVHVENGHSSATLDFRLRQFPDIVDNENRTQSSVGSIDTAVYAPEQLSIPKYLMIEPGQLARGELIGSGAHARVYKTTWLHCTFAEKKMKKSSLSTTFVQQEIDSLIKISRHPCIAQLVGLSVDKSGEFSIIMEYMHGTLRTLIKSRMVRRGLGGNGTRKGPFDFHEEVYIISNIALGMAYLHSRGLVHRDLKTCNVLAEDRFGSIGVKIADFGLAHLESDATQATNKFYDSWGTGMFRAPEVLPLPGKGYEEVLPVELPAKGSRADLGALKAMDVFSFGMTCYEVLTGIPPCLERPTNYVSEKVYAPEVRKGARPKWHVTPDSTLKSLVEKCWVLDPKKRPTFNAICEGLGSMLPAASR